MNFIIVSIRVKSEQIVKQQVRVGGCPTLIETLLQLMEAALNQTMFPTQVQALLGKAIGEHTTQQTPEFKSINNKDRQVAPKRMPLGARFTVNPHKMACRISEEYMVVDEPARGEGWTRKHS